MSLQFPSRHGFLPSFVLFTLLFFLQAFTITAQIIDPTKVPACALQCSSMIAAQNLCAPPVTPAPDTTCFCNSNFLVPFKNGQTTGVCDQICSAAELQSLLSYYKGLCGAQAAPAAPATKTTSGAAQVTVTVPATSSTGAASGSSSGKTRNNHKSWISEHYGWIIMIIVLVLAAIAGIIFGVWFKRRSARHPNTNRDAVLGTRDASHVLRDPHAIPGSSPPSTAQHTGGMNPREFYASTGSLRSGTSVPRSQTMRSMGSIGTGMMSPSASLVDSKGKAKADRNQITEVPGPMPPRRTSTKLQRKGSSGGILPPRSPI